MNLSESGPLYYIAPETTMRFLEAAEIAAWCSERGFELHESGKLAKDPQLVVLETLRFGQQAAPPGSEAKTAAACVRALRQWDECLLWVTLWGVWPSTENWPEYYAARAAQGERRSLEVAPGHLFNAKDETQVMQFLRLTLENAWDAHVLPVSGGRTNHRRVLISHDEWIEVYGRK